MRCVSWCGARAAPHAFQQQRHGTAGVRFVACSTAGEAVPYGSAQAPAETWQRFAATFRQRFLEATLSPDGDVADAALFLAAEDDALSTKASVPLPVDSYRERLEQLVSDFVAWHDKTTDAVSACALLDEHLYSATFENFRLAPLGQEHSPYRLYIHHALAQRSACPVALATIHLAVLSRLQDLGAVPPGLCVLLDAGRPRTALDCGARVTPRALILETLHCLMRGFWSWDWSGTGEGGGFLAAGRAASGEGGRVSTLIGGVVLQPTGRPFGELERSALALERIEALHPHPQQATRELGVLLAHRRMHAEALQRLRAYRDSDAARGDTREEADVLEAVIDVCERRLLEAAYTA